ncbi:MAG: trypsin-like peptidase domain-containing protein [Planctomycetota bacterium]
MFRPTKDSSGLPTSRLALLVAAFALLLSPTPLVAQDAETEDTATLTLEDSSGLQQALELEQHFRRIAEHGYQGTVTVTSFRRTPVSIFAAEATEAATKRWIQDSFSGEYPGYTKIAAASGVVMSAEGHVMTTRNVLHDADGNLCDLVSIETPDLRHTISEIVALEPTLNLALLKLQVYLEGDPPKFGVLPLANSGNARAGDWVFGVGNPWGPERYFGRGTLASMPDRDCYQELLSSTYVQSALTVHPEAYGGPLLNIRGEVLGILMPRSIERMSPVFYPRMGLEFALPSNILKAIWDGLRTNRSRTSPWLGFSVMSRPELRNELGPEDFAQLDKPRFGIFLENTFEPSPASKNDIQAGDFLVKFDNQLVHSPLVFQKLLYLAGVGTEVELEFYRDGESFTRRLAVEERPEEAITR